MHKPWYNFCNFSPNQLVTTNVNFFETKHKNNCPSPIVYNSRPHFDGCQPSLASEGLCKQNKSCQYDWIRLLY